MAKINIGISEKNRQAVANALNQLLADEHVLYNKTRSYHWNVESGNFMEMHKLYEEQYAELSDMIDDVAERIRMLGHYAEGRLKELLKLASLDEPQVTAVKEDQIANLTSDHETVIINLRKLIKHFDEKYQDAGSSDFVTGLIRQHEKMSWMLRSFLAK